MGIRIMQIASLTVAVVAVISLYITHHNYETTKEEAYLLAERHRELTGDYQRLQYHYSFILNGLGSRLDNLILTNVKGKKVELSEIVSQRKVIYRLQSDGCSSCLESDFKILSTVSRFLPKEDVIIISDIENFRSIQMNARKFNFEAQIYSFRNPFNVSADEIYQQVAAFFVVEQGLSISYIYQSAAPSAVEDQTIFIEKLRKLFSPTKHKPAKNYHEE